MNKPQLFGSYELIERLHAGPLAEVFRAHDRTNDREVAIKRLLPSVAREEEFIESFLDEAGVARLLVHPHIAAIYEIGRIDPSEYLALEYVNGRDLRAIIERASQENAPLPVGFVLDVAVQVCRGLEYAHEHRDTRRPDGVIHGEVSPANVLISLTGELKLINFGMASAVARLTQTQVGAVRSKFAYLSPEQAGGSRIDRRSDVFSLGACLWELLTLERLFAGENQSIILEKVRACDIPRLTDKGAYVPARLERIVMKALAKDPSERYATAAELETELNEFARSQNLVLDRSRASEYMQRGFSSSEPNRSNGEKSVMSEQKNGSDLDVFEGLSKKRNLERDDAPPTLAPPAPPTFVPPPFGRKTLVGMPLTQSAAPAPQEASNEEPIDNAHAPVAPAGGGFPTPSAMRAAMPADVTSPGFAPVGSPFGALPSFPSGSSPLGAMPAGAPGSEGPLPPFIDPHAAEAGSASTFGASAEPAPPARPQHNLDMDWDEENEQTSVFERSEDTTVYDRSEHSSDGFPYVPVAAAGGPMAPPMGYGSASAPYSSFPAVQAGIGRHPGSMTMPGMLPPPGPARNSGFPTAPPPAFRTMSGSQPPLAPPTLSPPTLDLNQIGFGTTGGSASLRRNRYVIGGVAAGVALVLSLFVASRRGGRVAVFTASTTGAPLSKLAVFVDGVQKCSSTPCTLDLDKGIHFIKAQADGYAAQGEGTTVHAGDEFALNFRLTKTSAGTGIKVNGKQDGVELFVDGKAIGPLPQEVRDLMPGPHKIAFKGSERYAPEERSVNVDGDELKDLGVVNLKVLRGLASFDVRTPGVKVTLVSGKDRRQLTDFSQPVDIETSKTWTIEATKPGFDDYRQPITFEDRAEKTFVVMLLERPPAPPPAVAAAPYVPRPALAPSPAPLLNTSTDTATEEAQPTRAAPAAGACTLNFNSIPVSNVLLDGRPIGGTPKIGVVAPAGAHNVLFVTPDTRKMVSVSCRAGETKPVTMRLNQE